MWMNCRPAQKKECGRTGSTTALRQCQDHSQSDVSANSPSYAFVEFYTTHVSRVEAPTDLSMASVCADIVRKFGRSKTLTGLRQAANDIGETRMADRIA
jgi:hypothetical protein